MLKKANVVDEARFSGAAEGRQRFPREGSRLGVTLPCAAPVARLKSIPARNSAESSRCTDFCYSVISAFFNTINP